MKNKKLLITIIVILGVVLIGTSCVLIINKPAKPTEPEPKKEEPKKVDNPNDGYNLRIIKQLSIDENFLVSPYSIEIALNMLKEGAKDNTREEIEKLVGTRDIKNIAVGDKIGVANGLFLKNKYKDLIEDKFKTTLVSKYSSEVIVDDFTSPKVINDWVKDKTKGMIDKVIDTISPNFVLGIANAIAIDVEWEEPFTCNNTTGDEFTKIDNSKSKVEMMHATYDGTGYKYFETENAKGAILPYKKVGNEELEFVGIIPNKDVNTYLSNLTTTELDNIDKNSKETSDDVLLSISLPRFKYSYEDEKFAEDLMNLGVKEVFNPDKANLRNIIPEGKMIENLYVNTAIHKTHIDLNEKGTKAAAVTFFAVEKNSAVIGKQKQYIIRKFDKPFFYMIRDKETKDIIFAGAVYSPNEWTKSTCDESN